MYKFSDEVYTFPPFTLSLLPIHAGQRVKPWDKYIHPMRQKKLARKMNLFVLQDELIHPARRFYV